MTLISQHLKTLARFPTVSRDHGANLKALKWIKDQIEELPLYLNAITVEGFPSLIITTQKTKTPRLWLSGHLDVVPAPSSAFQPRVIKDRLYARGALDMKGSVACYIELLLDIGDKLSEYDFGIMLTTDEELGGAKGVGSLLKNGYSSEVCWLPDGHKAWGLDTTAKGAVHFRVEVASEARHAALAWKGPGAIEKLTEILDRIRANFRTEPCGDDGHGHSTFSIGQIGGGEQTNSQAASAWAEFDVRLGNDLPHQKAAELVCEAVETVPGAGWEELVHAERFEINPSNQYLQLYRELAAAEGIKNVADIGAHGTSDARYFVNSGIPTVITRPEGGGSHEEDEWVSLKGLERFYRITRNFVERTARRE